MPGQSSRPILCASLIVLLSVLMPSVASSYVMSMESYDNMFKGADIVVIATPSMTQDSKVRLKLEIAQPKLITGIKTVETKFQVNHLLKGKLNKKTLNYLHLALKKKPAHGVLVFGAEGTFFVDFDAKENQSSSFILFLRKRKDGMYQASWRPLEGSRAILPVRQDGHL